MTEAVRIGDILRSLAPEANRLGWIAEQADAMQMGESNFKQAVYGNSAPSADNLRKIQKHFGRAFIDPYLDGTGFRVATEDEARRIDQLMESFELIENTAKGMRKRMEGKS